MSFPGVPPHPGPTVAQLLTVATHEGNHGSDLKAVELYSRAALHATATVDQQVEAMHMWAVYATNIGHYDAAKVLLEFLGGNRQLPVTAQHHAHLLRDYARVLMHISQRHPEPAAHLRQAYRLAQGSLGEFGAADPDSSQIGATLGLISRIEYAMGNPANALLTALDAWDHVREGDNRHYELDHGIWLTILMVYAGLPDTARSTAVTLLELVPEFGKPTHRQHLEQVILLFERPRGLMEWVASQTPT